MAQTVILNGPKSRSDAANLCRVAPAGSVCKISAPRRTNDQNALMWSLLSELARAKPEGRELPAETWKCLVMSEAGFESVWERSLDGRGMVPVGFKSSRLTKGEFSDVIEAIYAYGAEHGIEFSDV
jgi:hypothetical protein